ncbi:unnamed protein product [Phyllotreta striolata]|uniref:Flap endonuclease GEN n=1 Tax=Phyllotreta striolata TaxID=444603 RepID=A0A9N9TV77_PHYSR|nr:unnamed protein product [Phyllotreta striolata]
MGIKNLWTIFAPYCEKKPLFELHGKTVAIDLSCWVCEAQNVTEYQIHPRMYLRNLYFRTCYLLLMGVDLVFVLEGKAPELKYKTIAARNALQFKGAKPKATNSKPGKDRTRFNHVLKSCEKMLNYMGLSCIKGEGEAECLCAYLNKEGLVDGCISQDSDCFAYGAKVVYRNFSIASQGAQASSGGAVDIYDINKIYKEKNFGRNKLIAMALLCGNDYTDGVHGVGKESVLKLFEHLQDDEILNTLRSWRKETEKYDKLEKSINDKNICKSCGHAGKLQSHSRNGCRICGLAKGCGNEEYKRERQKITNELSIRSKALEIADFPNEELIQEFLVSKDNVTRLDLKWRQPDLLKFLEFATKYLEWDEIYAFEKLLPILTRWQCLNYDTLKNLKGIVQPECIKKIRNPKGIPSYLIVWVDRDDCYKDIIPKEQIEESKLTLEQLWSTVEPQNLVDKAYPELVETYRQSKIKPKATRRKNKNKNLDEISEMLKECHTNATKPKRIRQTKKSKSSKGDSLKQNSLDDFLKHQKPASKVTKDLDDSLFDDEDNNEDLSLIIENIISKTPSNLKNINIANYLTFDEDTEEPIENTASNRTSFFVSHPTEDDIFEKSFHELKYNDEDTIHYEYNELEYNDDNNKGDDSFSDIIYVPLLERLKKKM